MTLIDPAEAREGIILGFGVVTEEEVVPAMARELCTRPRRLHKDCSALPDPRLRAFRAPLPSLHPRRVAALHITMAMM